MNYQKIHDQIIERAKSENRQKGCGVYYERHHIVPKCMNGTDDDENLVLLTGREHFIIHKLLCEIYPNNRKLLFAFTLFINKFNSNGQLREYRISSREYERCKRLLSIHGHSSETKEKISKANRGRVMSDESNKKRSESAKGKTAWNKGRKMTEDELSRHAYRQPGYKPWNKGIPCSDETKQKISEANTGRLKGIKKGPLPTEIKEKISNTLKGNIPWNKGSVSDRVICSVCGNDYAVKYKKKHKCFKLGFLK